MAETLKGTCLCGGVEYEVQDPEALGYCHCTRCQRWTGSSLAGVVVAKENFRFTKGEDMVTRYESEFAPRNFCSTCGSSLYDDLGEKYFVAAGLMRDLELDPIALRQALEARGLDGAEVHEHVLATLLGDEPVAFRIVEPLDRTLCH